MNLKQMLKWGTTAKAGPDDGERPVQQVTYMDKTGPAAIMFPYGLHANVPGGRLGILGALFGKGEQRVLIPGSPRLRPKRSPEGEVVFYSPEWDGSTPTEVRLKPNGDLVIFCGGDRSELTAGDRIATTQGDNTDNTVGTKTIAGVTEVKVTSAGVVTITAPTIAVVGNQTVSGTVIAIGDVTGVGKSLATHTHGGGSPPD